MNGFLAFLLLLIAASLLLISGVAIKRRSGREESAGELAVMALMSGVAMGYLSYFLLGSAMAAFPIALAGVLVASWLHRAETLQTSAFCIGFGGLWTFFFGWQRWNDLSDPAVSYPGWTVYPLALGVALLVLGVVLGVLPRVLPRQSQGR
ncbi:MAG: hypothetical protein ABI578_06745 [Chloroflexota bacterium]